MIHQGTGGANDVGRAVPGMMRWHNIAAIIVSIGWQPLARPLTTPRTRSPPLPLAPSLPGATSPGHHDGSHSSRRGRRGDRTPDELSRAGRNRASGEESTRTGIQPMTPVLAEEAAWLRLAHRRPVSGGEAVEAESMEVRRDGPPRRETATVAMGLAALDLHPAVGTGRALCSRRARTSPGFNTMRGAERGVPGEVAPGGRRCETAAGV